MRTAIAVAILLAGYIGFRTVDFAHRVASPDFVALAFAEGGDDGYYFFTVARNFAQGFGPTVDRVHLTTGFQPLWALACSVAFWLAPDRGALAIIYGMSLALWLAGAILLVRFVRNVRQRALSPLAVAALAALFLCDSQLNALYVNGMETGLYLTLMLAVLVAFQKHLSGTPARPIRLIGLGGLMGLLMLARNDAVFLCASLLGATLFCGRRRRPLAEGLVMVASASVLVVPWLVYCQWVSGVPVPQSGLATLAPIPGLVEGELQLLFLIESVAPLPFVKMDTLLHSHTAACAVIVALAAIAIALMWKRHREELIAAPGKWVLGAQAISLVPLLLYYCLFSAEVHFFDRYFSPLKILVLVLLSILIAGALDRVRSTTVAAVAVSMFALGAVASNTYWVWRDFHLPYRSYMGEEAYLIMRSPYAIGTSQLGAPESGRLGFLFPTRVVNLDGKMRIDALQARHNGSLRQFLASTKLDYLMMSDYYVSYFDKVAAGWREIYDRVGTLGALNVFAMRASQR